MTSVTVTVTDGRGGGTAQTRGITFASVHDSYWTHACTVSEMSGIIRDTFIALHSSNVMEKLYEEVRACCVLRSDGHTDGRLSSSSGTRTTCCLYRAW